MHSSQPKTHFSLTTVKYMHCGESGTHFLDASVGKVRHIWCDSGQYGIGRAMWAFIISPPR